MAFVSTMLREKQALLKLLKLSGINEFVRGGGGGGGKEDEFEAVTRPDSVSSHSSPAHYHDDELGPRNRRENMMER